MVYMYHSFLIHSSADGHLGCFHVLAIINSAVMNIGVHVSLSHLVSSVCMIRSGIAGSYGNMRIFTWSSIQNEWCFSDWKGSEGLKLQLDHLPRCPTPPLPNTHKEIRKHTKQGLKITASKWWMNCTIVGSPPWLFISSKRDKSRTAERLRSQSALRT